MHKNRKEVRKLQKTVEK